MNKTLQACVKNLEELFDLFNSYLYNGELERPVISIQADKTGKAYGWCTTYKAWETTDGEEYYEINMCAEHMRRSFEDICGTLLHEMAHLYNLMNGVKDCNASQYHNKNFKVAAEDHGLNVERTKYGWSKTSLNDDLKEYIKSLDYSFDISRKADPAKKKIKAARKYHYYMCPCCESKCYSVQNLNIFCNDCGMNFEEYNK